MKSTVINSDFKMCIQDIIWKHANQSGAKGSAPKRKQSAHKKNDIISCDLCDFKTIYKSKNSLNAHMKAKHTDPYPYKCKHCFYRSPWESNLIEHLKTKHNIDQDIK